MRKALALLLAGALMVAVLTAPAPAVVPVLDVKQIFILQYKDFWDGTPETLPYGIEVWVTGSGISGVSMLDPWGGNHVFSDWDAGSEWGFEDGNFASLAALDASYGPGSYQFSFNGGVDTATINYQYTLPADPVNITYPADLQANVELNPIYTWDSAVALGDALGMWVVEDPDGLEQEIYGQVPADINLTSWQPGPLSPLTEYIFELSVFTIQGDEAPPVELHTDGADPFDYYGLFDYVNGVDFATVPEPATLAVLLGALPALLRRRRD